MSKWTRMDATKYTNRGPRGPALDIKELKPRHSYTFRKVGDGPLELVSEVDLSKVVEPRIPLWRRLWWRVTGPMRASRYRMAFERGVVIVRSDQTLEPPHDRQ